MGVDRDNSIGSVTSRAIRITCWVVVITGTCLYIFVDLTMIGRIALGVVFITILLVWADVGTLSRDPAAFVRRNSVAFGAWLIGIAGAVMVSWSGGIKDLEMSALAISALVLVGVHAKDHFWPKA